MNYSNQYQYQENFNINETDYNSNQILQEKEEGIKEEININIRLGFIRKVYGILAVQLLITSIFTLICMSSESVKSFLISNISLLTFNIFLEIFLSIVIICCRGISRRVPHNYLILLLFTLSESYIVGFICAFTKPGIVFMAATMTFIMVTCLTIYAITTKDDITMCGALFFILGSVFIGLIVFNLFFRFVFLHVLICCFGVVLFGLYIVYDTQIIIGKKREILAVDDYILGAFFIYTDIITIFLDILQILNYFSQN